MRAARGVQMSAEEEAADDPEGSYDRSWQERKHPVQVAAHWHHVALVANLLAWFPLAVSVIFVWPIGHPYNRNLLSDAVVLFWKQKQLPAILAIPPLVLMAASRRRLSSFGFVSLLLSPAFLAFGYFHALYLVPMKHGDLIYSYYHAQLQNCLEDCGSPWEYCLVPPVQFRNRSMDRHDAAVAEFRERLFGLPAEVSVKIDALNATVTMHVAGTRDGRPVRMRVHDTGHGQGILLGSSTPYFYADLIGAYRYWIHVPLLSHADVTHPYKVDGREIGYGIRSLATDASIFNTLAEALKTRLGEPVSLYGCSTHARSAVWAATTATSKTL